MIGKTLIVFLEGQRIGILQEDISGKHSFTYDVNAPAQLSLSMPRRSEPWIGKPIEAYIDGVLPDDPMMRRTIGKQYGVNGKETSALENCNDSALENRKILIQKIEKGLVKQCKRVESWFV